MTMPAIRPDDLPAAGAPAAATTRRPRRPRRTYHLTAAAKAQPALRMAGDPGPVARRLSQAVAEVLAGIRPARQLDDFAAPEVIRLLCRNAGRLGGPARPPRQRPVVSSVHVREPCPGAAEACAVIDTGPRRRAIALRLDADGARWRCTALHLG